MSEAPKPAPETKRSWSEHQVVTDNVEKRLDRLAAAGQGGELDKRKADPHAHALAVCVDLAVAVLGMPAVQLAAQTGHPKSSRAECLYGIVASVCAMFSVPPEMLLALPDFAYLPPRVAGQTAPRDPNQN